MFKNAKQGTVLKVIKIDDKINYLIMRNVQCSRKNLILLCLQKELQFILYLKGKKKK